MLYVLLIRPDGSVSAAKGPFEEAETDKIYGAIEEFERDYRLGDQIIGSLLEGGKVHVVRSVYRKDYDVLPD